jgi:hypothetical protein
MQNSKLGHLIVVLREAAIESSKGKDWRPRLALLLWFVYIFFRYLNDPLYSCIISPLNLGIHELGHLLFSPFGTFIGVFGGTLLQLSVPLLGMLNFYRQQDFFSIFLCFGWLSVNLFDVTKYIADARTMSLPLVTPFGSAGSVIHDWNYLLGRLNLLQFDTFIAWLVKAAAVIAMLICLAGGGCLLRVMKESRTG